MQILLFGGDIIGNYIIVIKGIGPHHNKDNSTDANHFAKELMGRLVENGHSLSSAEFCSSEGIEDLKQ